MSTYKDLQDAVIEQRFNANMRVRVKRWLNARYVAIWNAGDWNFKRVTGQSISVVGDDTTPAMPSDFAESLFLFDDNGEQIGYMEPDDFRPGFAYRTDSGQAEAYTVSNRQIILAPTPDMARTYTLDYRRRVAHVDESGDVAVGIMSADGDQPLWPAEHDELLIVDTIMHGMQMGNDPAWVELKASRDELFDAFAGDVGLDSGGTTRDYGRDNLC